MVVGSQQTVSTKSLLCESLIVSGQCNFGLGTSQEKPGTKRAKEPTDRKKDHCSSDKIVFFLLFFFRSSVSASRGHLLLLECRLRYQLIKATIEQLGRSPIGLFWYHFSTGIYEISYIYTQPYAYLVPCIYFRKQLRPTDAS
jgi:hypothetical protein